MDLPRQVLNSRACPHQIDIRKHVAMFVCKFRCICNRIYCIHLEQLKYSYIYCELDTRPHIFAQDIFADEVQRPLLLFVKYVLFLYLEALIPWYILYQPSMFCSPEGELGVCTCRNYNEVLIFLLQAPEVVCCSWKIDLIGDN